MIDLITGLLGDFWPKVMAGLALVGAILGGLWKARRDAVKLDQAKRKAADHAKADAVRDRVERDLSKRLRDFDDAGFRD